MDGLVSARQVKQWLVRRSFMTASNSMDLVRFARDLKGQPNFLRARKGFSDIGVFRPEFKCDEAIAVLAIYLKVWPDALRSFAEHLRAL